MKHLVAALCVATSLLMAASYAYAGETIRIASEGYYPPFNYFDDGGKLADFDIDIGQALCEKMEADCAFVQQDWEALIAILEDGVYETINENYFPFSIYV